MLSSVRFDRKKFFDGFKAQFDDTLDQGQVDGIEFLLGRFETDETWTTNLRNIAYALATIYHETAGSMQPVEEGYYLAKYGKNRVKTFQKSLRYFPYFGRGYVQLTWKANYAKAAKFLDIDLVNQPELALEKETAFEVMEAGMFEGWFVPGQTLGKYIHGDKCDYKGARRIINGQDKAALVAGYAEQFEEILKDSAAVPAGGNSSSLTENSDGQSDPSRAADNANSAAKPPSETVVVEKEETLPLWKKLWQKFAAWVAGIGGTAKLQEYHEQFQQLGVPVTAVRYALYAAIAGFLIWLVYECVNHLREKYLKRLLTTSLIAANSTPTNTVMVVESGDLESLERQGYTVVRRK